MPHFLGRRVGAALAAASLTASLSVGALAADRIAFGSTATSSVHYAYSAAAAKAVNDASDKVDITVISTGGAVDNLARIARGQIAMGLGTYDTIYQAYEGIGAFEGKPQKDLRGLWIHAPATQAWVVRQDSGVETLDDLKGKAFAPGQRGSATEQLVIQMLGAMNIEPELFRAPLSDVVDSVKDGRAIGYVKAGGAGTLDGTTLELMAFTPIRALSFTPEHIKAVHAKFPFIKFQTYEKGLIEGQGAVTTPVQVVGQFTTADGLTDEQVAAILAGVIDNVEQQAAAFPTFGKIDVAKDSLDLISIPLHKGAVKFYRDRGYTVPDHLIPPEMASAN